MRPSSTSLAPKVSTSAHREPMYQGRRALAAGRRVGARPPRARPTRGCGLGRAVRPPLRPLPLVAPGAERPATRRDDGAPAGRSRAAVTLRRRPSRPAPAPGAPPALSPTGAGRSRGVGPNPPRQAQGRWPLGLSASRPLGLAGLAGVYRTGRTGRMSPMAVSTATVRPITTSRAGATDAHRPLDPARDRGRRSINPMPRAATPVRRRSARARRRPSRRSTSVGGGGSRKGRRRGWRKGRRTGGLTGSAWERDPSPPVQHRRRDPG